jgi:hypothetical protein
LVCNQALQALIAGHTRGYTEDFLSPSVPRPDQSVADCKRGMFLWELQDFRKEFIFTISFLDINQERVLHREMLHEVLSSLP